MTSHQKLEQFFTIVTLREKDESPGEVFYRTLTTSQVSNSLVTDRSELPEEVARTSLLGRIQVRWNNE